MGAIGVALDQIGGWLMINLRYHVFSLVAVFAALAIGIVVGSTTVRSGLVDNLRGNVERAEERITEVETENDELSTRARQLELLEEDGVQLVADAVPGVPILWITAPGLDGDVWRGVQRMARSAGAVTIGRVVVEREVFDTEDVADLADALDSSSSDPAELQAILGATLAARIAGALDVVEAAVDPSGPPDDTTPDDTALDDTAPDDTAPGDTAPGDTAPDGPVVDIVESGTGPDVVAGDQTDEAPTTSASSDDSNDDSTSSTVPPVGADTEQALTAALGDLEDEGLIDLKELGAGGLEQGAMVQIVVLEDLRAGIDSAPVLVPLADDLSRDGQRSVVLAEARAQRLGDDTPESVVAQVRDSGRLSDQMSTIDNLEDSTGWIATILAVRNGVQRDLGHFGYRDGSDHLLPQPVP